MKLNELEAVIEAILFVTGEPVTIADISDTIKMDKATTKAIINSLISKYKNDKRGLKIIELESAYQMCTEEFCFEYLKDMYSPKLKPKLSQVMMETLTIIAYKQPVTKADIEEIRGVDATHAINRLLERNLIEEAGRLDSVGKPILFQTTDEFLRYFSLKSKNDLPGIGGDYLS